MKITDDHMDHIKVISAEVAAAKKGMRKARAAAKALFAMHAAAGDCAGAVEVNRVKAHATAVLASLDMLDTAGAEAGHKCYPDDPGVVVFGGGR